MKEDNGRFEFIFWIWVLIWGGLIMPGDVGPWIKLLTNPLVFFLFLLH